jgi:hypothetical protein
MPQNPGSGALQPEESITQNTPDAENRVRHNTPEEIVIRLDPDAQQYLLEQVVTIVQDQIALQRHFESNGRSNDIYLSRINAFEKLGKLMRRPIPELGKQ